MTDSIERSRALITQGLKQYLPEFVLALDQEDVENYIINGSVSRRFRLQGRFAPITYTKIMHLESDTYADALLDGRIPEHSENAIYCGEAVACRCSPPLKKLGLMSLLVIVKDTGKVVRRGSRIRLPSLANNTEIFFVYERPKPWLVWLILQDQRYGVVYGDNVALQRGPSPAPKISSSDVDYEQLFTAGGREQEYWISIFQKAIERKSRFGYTADVVTCMTALSLIHIIYHELELADAVLEKAWTISTQIQKPSVSLLDRMNTLGSIFEEYERYSEAQSIYHRILERSRPSIGATHNFTHMVLNNMISLLTKQGKYDEALDTATELQKSQIRLLGSDHPATINTIQTLGNLYREQGKLEEAGQLLSQTLDVSKKVLGKDSSSAVNAMNSLGNLYSDQGRLDEAEQMLLQALQSCEMVFGSNHTRTLDIFNNLALVYMDQGRLAESETLLLRAESGYESALGSNHPSTLDTVNNLGLLYQAQGKLDQAEQMYRATLRAREKSLGSEHPDTLTSINNLAEVLRQGGRYEEAENMHRKVLNLYEKILGAEHPDTLVSMSNLGIVLNEQVKYGEAERIFRAASAIYTKVLGESHPSTLASINNLAEVLQAKSQHEAKATQVTFAPDAEQTTLGNVHHSTLTDHQVLSSEITRNFGSSRAPLSAQDYYVGWICVLHIEQTAAIALLDEQHDMTILTGISDSNSYTLGRMHQHNVVIACLPAGTYGIASAATIARNLIQNFSSVRFILTVGIGGGIPNLDKGRDIRLGDVVVSYPSSTNSGVVQYDTGKVKSTSSLERRGLLNRPPEVLLTALAGLQQAHTRSSSRIPSYIVDVDIRYPRLRRNGFMRPEEVDVLYHALHKEEEVSRPLRETTDPVVHYGTIASSSQVTKDAGARDRIGSDFDAICIEMEAAGLTDTFGGLVVRGICDYADAYKNDKWQRYAALTAAAFAKELLYYVSEFDANEEKSAGSQHEHGYVYDYEYEHEHDRNTLASKGDLTEQAQKNNNIRNVLFRRRHQETYWESLSPDVKEQCVNRQVNLKLHGHDAYAAAGPILDKWNTQIYPRVRDALEEHNAAIFRHDRIAVAYAIDLYMIERKAELWPTFVVSCIDIAIAKEIIKIVNGRLKDQNIGMKYIAHNSPPRRL